MTRPSLKIAGLDLSIIGWLNFDQQIEPISGSSVRRMASGAAYKTSHWRKYRISLSGSGWIPVALNAVNYDAPFEIELPRPVGLTAAESLPAGWESRSAPWAEKSVTDQAGVVIRLVYPKLTVIAEPPSQMHGMSNSPSWSLVMEQV